MEALSELKLPHRLLLGPGPSMVHSRVLRAMNAPLLGHLDPTFLLIMDEIQQSLRWLFQTRNTFTIAVSGTGSAAMETVIVNLVEPEDTVIVGISGIFGTRLASIVERCGGTCNRVEAPWGQRIDISLFEQALNQCKPVKAVAIVHAETSTGVLQPLEDLSTLCRKHNALFIVDAVTSLGGLPLEVDQWNIDACYSATQKCLSCPPGLAPLTLSERALDTIKRRKRSCQSWYMDCSLVANYWEGTKRSYHHTAPISMIYALREALRLIQEEGLAARFERHRLNSRALLAGLNTLGFHLLPPSEHSLPMLICVTPPPFIEELAIRKALLNECHIEIGGGLGSLQGKVWRIGLMGESSRQEYILTFLSALERLMVQLTHNINPGDALKAAATVYERDTSAMQA